MSIGAVTHIHLAAVHFGSTAEGASYIHLNDHHPSSSEFHLMWNEITKCQSNGIRIILMIGGAGGGFTELFRNYDTCLPLLLDVLVDHQLDGVDLDVEETVNINDVKRLIQDIRANTKSGFIISMAPLLKSLQQDQAGMGGFVYKDLFTSAEGQCIDYFTVQAYDSYTCDDYQQMLYNQYPKDKLVLGMIYTQPLDDCLRQISHIVDTCGSVGGVSIWEYCFADGHKPADWATKVAHIMNRHDE